MGSLGSPREWPLPLPRVRRPLPSRPAQPSASPQAVGYTHRDPAVARRLVSWSDERGKRMVRYLRHPRPGFSGAFLQGSDPERSSEVSYRDARRRGAPEGSDKEAETNALEGGLNGNLRPAGRTIFRADSGTGRVHVGRGGEASRSPEIICGRVLLVLRNRRSIRPVVTVRVDTRAGHAEPSRDRPKSGRQLPRREPIASNRPPRLERERRREPTDARAHRTRHRPSTIGTSRSTSGSRHRSPPPHSRSPDAFVRPRPHARRQEHHHDPSAVRIPRSIEIQRPAPRLSGGNRHKVSARRGYPAGSRPELIVRHHARATLHPPVTGPEAPKLGAVEDLSDGKEYVRRRSLGPRVSMHGPRRDPRRPSGSARTSDAVGQPPSVSPRESRRDGASYWTWLRLSNATLARGRRKRPRKDEPAVYCKQ